MRFAPTSPAASLRTCFAFCNSPSHFVVTYLTSITLDLLCVSPETEVDPVALTGKLRKALRAKLATGRTADFADFLRAMFERDQQSVRMIRRSASGLLRSPGVAQRKIVERHHTGLHSCGELVGKLQAYHERLLRLDPESRQVVVLTLLWRGAVHDDQLSFVAVALMYTLLHNCTDPAMQFLRDGAVVYFHQHRTVLNDDYHRAFCAIVIGSTCDITSPHAVKSIIESNEAVT